MDKIGQPLIRLAGALAAVGVVTAALFPARGHVGDVWIGLVLVVPLIAAVAIGGFAIGALAAVVTFLLYDLIYVPPYGTLTVQNNESLLPLVVFAAVLVTAALATNLRRARADAERRELEARRLFELTEALITNRPLDDLLSEVVMSVRASFGLESTALLVASDEGLTVAAETGLPFNEEELRLVAPTGGVPRSLGSVVVGSRRVLGVPLAATGEPIGVLVLAGESIENEDLGVLRTYANQAAFAVERARLQQSALQSELLRQVDTWRSALLGAVSHDLRTPLASVKAAVSDLRSEHVELTKEDTAELLELIEAQADRLDRLVTNLLDMTRIEFGELEVREEVTTLDKLVSETLDSFGPARWTRRVAFSFPADLPPVLVDRVLVCQVFANLLENADRHAPDGSLITIEASRTGELVEVAVEDEGPGVPIEDRTRIFKMFNRISGGGRAGIGLAIVAAFLGAHGQSVHVEQSLRGGARFVFTLPVASPDGSGAPT